MKNKTAAALILAMGAALNAQAQSFGMNQDNEWKKWRITGSVQSDVLVPQDDETIGTEHTDNWALTNSYVQLGAINKYIEAGARLEFTEYPLPGFERDFKGWGVPFYYVKGNYRGFELTGGTYYDQFGSGLILRTYEERSLGIDNSLRGGRLVVDALKGVRLKALAGQQRRYWDTNPAWIYGADAEINVHDWCPRMMDHGTALTFGASWVTKDEDSEVLSQTNTSFIPLLDDNGKPVTEPVDPDKPDLGTRPVYTPIITSRDLNLPQRVGAFDVRANLRRGNWNFLGEYAQKGQDPSFDNGYVYRPGRALLLTGSYSKRGMSFLAQAKRSEDMSFRSRRSGTLTSSFINHLPAFTAQQTYALATIYPYATQNVPGEWAFQAEGSYTFKKKTPLGGKYGTTVKASFSHVRSGKTDITHDKVYYDTMGMLYDYNAAGAGAPLVPDYYYLLTNNKPALMGTNGALPCNFWKMGDDKYYQEITVDLEKKLSKTFKLNLKYLNQHYNKTVVEGEGGMIKANIAIAEGKWNINRRMALRAEAQYLHTNQDQKDWYFGLVEFSLLPHFMFTLSDQYNAHVVDATGQENKVHYFQGLVTFTQKAHRLSVGYGKTRAGYNCSGGVCRYVPAQKGLTASYSYNF